MHEISNARAIIFYGHCIWGTVLDPPFYIDGGIQYFRGGPYTGDDMPGKYRVVRPSQQSNYCRCDSDCIIYGDC